MSLFLEVIEEIQGSSKNTYEKGRYFEDIIEKYLNDNWEYAWLTDVHRYTDWEHKKGGDTGVDLVGWHENRKHWVGIQCKYRSGETKIGKDEINSFVAELSRKHYGSGMLVHLGKLTKNVRDTLNDSGKDIKVVDDVRLNSADYSWPSLEDGVESGGKSHIEKYTPKEFQQDAINAIGNGLMKNADVSRGQMILPCGTGKTFTSLKIAETYVGAGGTILYLVPALALIQQTMLEWRQQSSVPLEFMVVCSDKTVATEDLTIPVDTKSVPVAKALGEKAPAAMKVLFCTYQSINIVLQAQKKWCGEFDLVFIDEAHRTTGLDKSIATEGKDSKERAFGLINSPEHIQARKRLYMTATPKMFESQGIDEAEKSGYGVYSMDDEEIYGKELYSMTFGEAVAGDHLCNYEIVVAQITDAKANEIRNNNELLELAKTSKYVRKPKDGALKTIDDFAVASGAAIKAIVGEQDGVPKMKKAIAFCGTLRDSKFLKEASPILLDEIHEETPDIHELEAKHVDGSMRASLRKEAIAWLDEDKDDTAKLLTNPECLSEGVDVPALDAVIFLSAKTSYIDCIQAVGRVMRNAKGKEKGYIILPIIATGEATPDKIDAFLIKNPQFKQLIRVVDALRSADEEFNKEINHGRFPNMRNVLVGTDEEAEKLEELKKMEGYSEKEQEERAKQLAFLEQNLAPVLSGIQPTLLKHFAGARQKAWESWAADTTKILKKLTGEIKEKAKASDAVAQTIDGFTKELNVSAGQAFTKGDTHNMIAQNIITKEVFVALFGDTIAASKNAISDALTKVEETLVKNGLEFNTDELNDFYMDVRERAEGSSGDERQALIKILYSTFLATAFKDKADKYGVVYTPNEIVDCTLRLANSALEEEFGKGLTAEGVNILDPFSGTGTFLTRLLLNENLIKEKDLERKFTDEVYANEIMFLPYFISEVAIEEAYMARRNSQKHEEFENMLLADTFDDFVPVNQEGQEKLGGGFSHLAENENRRKNREDVKMRAIISNPPWRAGQKDSSSDNPNDPKVKLSEAIHNDLAKIYAESVDKNISNAGAITKDSYFKAMYCATQDIINTEGGGVVAFITPTNWTKSKSGALVRKYFSKKFSSIWHLNFRGCDFGAGAEDGAGKRIFNGDDGNLSANVAVGITILIDNPDKRSSDKCEIVFAEVEDDLERDAKLAIANGIFTKQDLLDMPRGQIVTPNSKYEWVNQGNHKFYTHDPIGDKQTKAGKLNSSIFRLYSLGYITARDPWASGSNKAEVIDRAEKGVAEYNDWLDELLQKRMENPKATIKPKTTENMRWHKSSEDKLHREISPESVDESNIRLVQFRPFYRQWVHWDKVLNSSHYQLEKIFPTGDSDDLAIAIEADGTGSPQMITPPPHYTFGGTGAGRQCFPRFTYRKLSDLGADRSNIFGQPDDDSSRVRLPLFKRSPSLPSLHLQNPRQTPWGRL